jgi:biotin operon repressor
MKDMIAIPKSLRLEWIDILARDHSLPDGAFRAAVVISTHFNNRTGTTFLSYETIATEMNKESRTIQDAVKALRKTGYILVGQRHLGYRKSDGRRVSGGRGNANTYTPSVKNVKLFETARGRKLADNCDLYERRRSKIAEQKVEENFLPTLPSPTEKDSQPSLAETAFCSFARHLESRLGPAIFKSWFRTLVIESINGEKATLSVEGRFVKSRVLSDYTDAIIRCLQVDQPKVRSIEVMERPPAMGKTPRP